MSERTGLSGWSSIIATWVSILGAAGGGFIALTTYGEEVAKMEDGRVVQTFALFEMFNSAERLQSRQRIFDHVHANADYSANDLYIFLDFYDALQVCVERNLCDQDLAVRLFQSYAVPVWDGLASTIVGGRTESDPHFGGGLEWMAALPMPSSTQPDAAQPDAQESAPDSQEPGATPEAAPGTAIEEPPAPN